MRRHDFDNIRWMTVVLVVVFHTVYMYSAVGGVGVAGPLAAGAAQPQDAIQYLLYPWFMSLLFVVSGACARLSLNKRTPKQFFEERTRRMLVPSTLGLLAFQWIQGAVNMSLSHAFDEMSGVPAPILYLIMSLSGTGVLWTIQMLWLYSVLLLLVRKLERGRLAALGERANLLALELLGVGFYLCSQVLNTPVITVYHFGMYGFCFFAGYFVFVHEAVADRLARYAPWLAGSAVCLGVAYVALYFGENYAAEPTVVCPLALAFGWQSILAILGCMRRWGNRTGSLAQFMGKRSFGLYVFHYLPISLCGLLFSRAVHLPPVAAYCLTLLAGFGGGFALNALISRIPVLRYLTLGIRKKA